MGQKVSPIGFRTGVTLGWQSTWFAPKASYGEFLVEDQKVRRYIDNRFNRSMPKGAVAKTEIIRTRNEVKVTLHSARPGVVIAGRDRVAVDAVGVAVLRLMGTTPEVSAGEVFQQEQIRRAVELGIGVDSPEKIELVVPDAESQAFAESVASLLGTSLRPVSVRRAGWGEIKSQKGK